MAKKMTLPSGKVCFFPHKVYCFSSIINELEKMVQRSGITEMCEMWRSRNMDEGVMADIYDGVIWKEFQVFQGKEFLKIPRNFAFGRNVDWFQPFKHRKDRSVGVIYLVLLNLPGQECYKWENIIVVGIIPELNKEPKSLNPFLRPVIDEMQAMWRGVRLQSSTSLIPQLYRAAILFVSADIPALRKLCGFKEPIELVLSVSNFFQGHPEIQLTSQVLTKKIGLLDVILVIRGMQKKFELLQQRQSMTN